ncbi:MAG: DUF5777 family beta-barrel protein [Flavobacteriaceae bacterium]|nr:DUF5777 family beta-barrel protein [Flavobacteriaceae bacterium]
MEKLYFLLLLVIPIFIFSQEDLLGELDDEIKVDKTVNSTFEALKIINIESSKVAGKGDFYFLIAHRFGTIKNGLDDLFGLDAATIKFSFFYGATDRLQLGVARSEFRKTYDLNVKYKIARQVKDGFPFTITSFSSVGINTLLDSDDLPNLEFQHRLTYLSELLISKKVNANLSLQVAPIFIHENLVADVNQDNSQFAIALAGSYRISNSISLTGEFVPHLNRASDSEFNNALSLGIDWQVGGHVFQLMFTNSQQLNDSQYVTNATGNWSDGDIFFGFNLYRVF